LSHEKIENLKRTLFGESSQPEEGYTFYDSFCMIFWKRQNYNQGKCRKGKREKGIRTKEFLWE
jgi:hypothetical protein